MKPFQRVGGVVHLLERIAELGEPLGATPPRTPPIAPPIPERFFFFAASSSRALFSSSSRRAVRRSVAVPCWLWPNWPSAAVFCCWSPAASSAWVARLFEKSLMTFRTTSPESWSKNPESARPAATAPPLSLASVWSSPAETLANAPRA